MRGLVSTPMENQDQFMSGEITNHLFEERGIRYSGLDLAALNIQRGRDHGLRPYNEYRVACNLKKAQDFSDLDQEISQDVIKRLRQVYDHVDDIDLFTGGLSETPLQGALVGMFLKYTFATLRWYTLYFKNRHKRHIIHIPKYKNSTKNDVTNQL